MVKWQYKYIDHVEWRAMLEEKLGKKLPEFIWNPKKFKLISAVEAVLNELGEEGWELVSYIPNRHVQFIFKRPKN